MRLIPEEVDYNIQRSHLTLRNGIILSRMKHIYLVKKSIYNSIVLNNSQTFLKKNVHTSVCGSMMCLVNPIYYYLYFKFSLRTVYTSMDSSVD